MACLLIGMALALCGLGKDSASRLIGVLGPIGATLGYPIWGWTQGFSRNPGTRERFADNCYYLGFIFTQLALVVGFLPVALFSRVITSQDVMRFFGLALGASLVGLVARTFFIQTGHTLAENAEIVEGEVDALARMVSDRSRKVLGEFEALSAKLGESYAALGANLNHTATALESTMRRFDAAVRADIEVLETEGRSAGAATAAAAESIAGKHAEFADKVGAASQALERLKVGLLQQADEAGRTISETAASINRGLGALQEVSGLARSVESLDVRLSTITDQMSSVGARIEGAGERVVATTDEAIRTAQGAIERTKADALARAEGLGSELQSAVTSLEDTLSAFRAEMERIRV